ncbi:MAG TPA: type IIL restriction-modification enzyme MmeI [Verrucomicrobiae bacterium]
MTPPYGCEQLRGRRLFHWAVEFPEVFQRGGFDALVGNPPYLGAPKLTGTFGNDYRGFLITHLAHGVKGLADFCAYFVLRTGAMMSAKSICGLVVTSAIAEGDTRTVGLQQLTDHGWEIIRATSRAPWPGTASVTYSSIWLCPKKWGGHFFLNNEIVPGITPMLTVKQSVTGPAQRLKANLDKSFNGVKVYGDGFVIPPVEAHALLKKDARNKAVLFPYITTKDVNSHATYEPAAWAIRFFDWPLDRESAPPDYSGHVASDFPDCLQIVVSRVKPERTRRDANGEFVVRHPMPQLWWIYGEKRPGLYAAISNLKHVLAVGTQATKYVAFALLDKAMVFSHSLSIIADDSFETLAVLHSSHHEVWARHYGGYNLALLRYSPTDLFETFPFPPQLENIERIGLAYHEHRQSVMTNRQEGLTDTYNRFHDRGEKSEDIERLRTLHIAMDQAVAAAYGWNDLDLGHGFHETKQGERFTISESARRTVLDKLLELNHQRYEEELKAGLHEKKAGRATKSRKATKITAPATQVIELQFGLGLDTQTSTVRSLPSGFRFAVSDPKIYSVNLVTAILSEAAGSLTWPQLRDAFVFATRPDLMKEFGGSEDTHRINDWSKRWNEKATPKLLPACLKALFPGTIFIRQHGNDFIFQLADGPKPASSDDVGYDAWLSLRVSRLLNGKSVPLPESEAWTEEIREMLVA